MFPNTRSSSLITRITRFEILDQISEWLPECFLLCLESALVRPEGDQKNTGKWMLPPTGAQVRFLNNNDFQQMCAPWAST